ncbi:codeine O-demethylase-like [Silene latifolia]|uniref:codeine O-demethylase-like n=1 Tax=Silene latifolia TaxID=37657 RepID=UPI003D775D4B
MDSHSIDLQLLLDFSSPCAKQELLKLRNALTSWGCFQIMSNGILKSSVHRAVIDKEKERMSVAVPSSVAIDNEIGPLSELFDKDRPRLYKNVDNYIPTFLQHYARGET